MRRGINKSGLVLAAVMATTGIAACSTDDDADVESPETPSESPSATPAAEPENSPVPEASGDEWADAMWDEHIAGLVDWWNDHYESECDLTETECVEHFSEGIDPLSAFAEDVRNSGDELPDYVRSFYAGEVAQTSMQMEAYMHACLDRNQCSNDADGLEQDVYELISEASTWGD